MAPSAAMEETPNWLEMPPELMASILKRLGALEILNSGRKVCTSWRRICKDPAMWNVIDLFEDWIKWDANNDLEKVTKEAVDLSCGELIDITIYDYVTDDLLEHVVQRSSKLKHLRLVSCSRITDSVLRLAVKKLPHLEELQLHHAYITAEDVKAIGRNCPQLKYFALCSGHDYSRIKDSHALAIANSMPQLRHLQLNYNEMTNDGLRGILNGCPHLQSLHLGKCNNLDLDGILVKMCIERIEDFRYDSPSIPPIEEYDEFNVGDIYDFSDGGATSEVDDNEGDIYHFSDSEADDTDYADDYGHSDSDDGTSEADDRDYADDYGHSDYYGWYFVILLLTSLCWFSGVFCSPVMG